MRHLIDFEAMDWVESVKGLRYKKYTSGSQQVRLVEFSEGFIEADWCRKGHAGYVLEGSFANDYDGAPEYYKAGDSFFIPSGENDKHKVVMAAGETVKLLLFETLN